MSEIDTLEREYRELRQAYSEFAALFQMPGWKRLREWHVRERDASSRQLASQILSSDPGIRQQGQTTAALVEAGDRLLERENAILEGIQDRIRELQSDHRYLKAKEGRHESAE